MLNEGKILGRREKLADVEVTLTWLLLWEVSVGETEVLVAAAVVAGWETDMVGESSSLSRSKLVMSAADLFRGRDLWRGGWTVKDNAGT